MPEFDKVFNVLSVVFCKFTSLTSSSMDFGKAVINQRKIRQPFTKEEDRIIKNFIHKYGVENLEKLEMELENRSTRQIRERYRLYLDPEVNYSPFTVQEDELLLEAFDQFQGKWSLMVKLFSV
jgi:hypothetical protein